MVGKLELKGMHVLVIGLARTGVATALFCAERGAAVTVTDARSAEELGESIHQLRAADVQLQLGGYTDAILQAQQLVIPSPGVPADSPILVTAHRRQIPVWSEIELAFRFLKGKLVGITGSNGKTTTTALVEHILRHAGFAATAAGNIGTPLVASANDSTDSSVAVTELSSFQLELIETFRPSISVWLNLTPDHLDRHKSFQAYAAAKARIFENQTEEDFAVLNLDDAASLQYAPSRPQLFWFSRKTNVEQGAFVRDGKIICRRARQEETILDCSEIPIPGAHNLENVLAATIAARLVGAQVPQISEAIRSFAGVEHRIEFVAEIHGVRYYNDSKATNVDATLKALQAFPGHIIVIFGGKDKDSDYTQLRETLREKAILALLIGAAADKIAQQIEGSVAIQRAGTLENAVHVAAQSAHDGDVVLLAPACASFDQFQNYEHRGRVFKELVHQLPSSAEQLRQHHGVKR
ncbi:MAG TPA: UDP-N-acetylmuramoyl-L-alanine--D-glutamate ligase [Candidatus Acidoferrum sp.]|jgi:UDP-N-acetylmuramoylalanine--D-glutamate ligase